MPSFATDIERVERGTSEWYSKHSKEIHHIVPGTSEFGDNKQFLCVVCNPGKSQRERFFTVIGFGLIALVIALVIHRQYVPDDAPFPILLVLGGFLTVLAIGIGYWIFFLQPNPQKVIADVRSFIESENRKAIATARERTPDARAAYLREHPDELRRDAAQIKEDYEFIFSHPAGVEFYRKYAGDKVIEMWEEPYRRLVQLQGVGWEETGSERKTAEPDLEEEATKYERALTAEGMTESARRQAHINLILALMAKGHSREEAEEIARDAEANMRRKGPRP